MRVIHKNLSAFGDKFSGRMHEAFKRSSLNKFYSTIEIERMITYNEILGEFIDLGYQHLYDEFETRLVAGENPNKIFQSILAREENQPTLGYLLNHVEYFIDSDITKMFI